MSSSTAVPNYRVFAQGKHFHWGVFSAMITICIWASWLLSVKLGIRSNLTMFDLAIMRYGLPSFVFCYCSYLAWEKIRATSPLVLIGICFGAGVPFFYLASQGMTYAPVAHSGLLIAGTAPLFVTSIAVLFYKEPLSLQRLFGLFAIMVGIAVLLAASFINTQIEALIGDLYFLGASICWAIFTICLRVSGLSPFAATGLLGLVNSVILLLLFAVGVLDSGMIALLPSSELTNDGAVSLSFILMQFLIQAIMVGVLAGVSYGIAIARIGAEATAAIGSLTPVLAALGAYFLLEENLLTSDVVAMLLVVVGVVLASEIMSRFAVFSVLVKKTTA